MVSDGKVRKAYREINTGCGVGREVRKLWHGNAANRIAEIIAHAQFQKTLDNFERRCYISRTRH